MVRVASLRGYGACGLQKNRYCGNDGNGTVKTGSMWQPENWSELQYSTYNRSLVPQLEAKGIRIIDAFEELTAEQQEFVDKYFEEDGLSGAYADGGRCVPSVSADP